MKLRNKKTGEIKEFVLFGGNELQGGATLESLTEEWEDYEEPKEYWYINTEMFDIDYGEVGKNDLVENFNKQIGNYFDTREEAEKAVEKLKAWKRLKDKGFKLDAVVDSFFCLDMYMKGEFYEEIKEDLKIVFGGGE